jgi:hypothetical protein
VSFELVFFQVPPHPCNSYFGKRKSKKSNKANAMTIPDETLKKLAHGFVIYTHPNGQSPEKYGISATDFSSDSKRIHLTFTFLSGRRYCCNCSSCHHGLLVADDYERLRESFRQAGVEVGRPMKIYMRVVCESGSLFDDGPRTGESLPPAYETLERYECEELYDERWASHD